MQKPSIGRIVHVLCDPAFNNGADVAPAVITRVWDERKVDDRPTWLINARLLYDSDQTGWKTSVHLFADEDAAREAAEDAGASDAPFGAPVTPRAFWPARS